jgi:hypothetical protein
MLVPPLFAAAAVALGKEAGWDFLNYHWYVPYALLNGRVGFDLAVAHHATYYNPLMDVPLYLIAQHAPAWCAGAYLGFLFGVAVALIAAIADQLLRFADWRWQTGVVALVTASGALGAGAMSGLGNTANDVPASIGVLLAVLIVLRHVDVPRTLWLAGICCGLSVGLKLTTGIYAIAFALTTVITAPGWRARLARTLPLSVGLLAGFLITAGFWMWRMWRFSGNPLLPYFNDWFQSPLLVHANFRDTSFIPGEAWQVLAFPFLFTANSLYVAEWLFRDERIVFAYVLVPVALLMLALEGQDPTAPVQVAAARWLLIFGTLAYVIWLFAFSIYRYLIPLEMLAPLLITTSVLLWPVRLHWRLAAALALLVLLQVTMEGIPGRLPWGHRYVELQAPPLADAGRSMVLMTGIWASAYAIPAFPPEVPFLRVDGWLIMSGDRTSGMAREMRRRVSAHRGPLYALFSPLERDRAVAALSDYELQMGDDCRPVTSNLNNLLTLCELRRD